MVVGEPSLMGGEFGDEDERLITRLGLLANSLFLVSYLYSCAENNQFDPNALGGSNGLEDSEDFGSLGSSSSANPSGGPPGLAGNNSAGIIGPGGTNGGGPPSWPTNNAGNPGNNGPNPGGNGPSNGQNPQDDSKKQSPNLSQ